MSQFARCECQSSQVTAARPDPADLLRRLCAGRPAGSLLHVEQVPARAGETVAWPEWVPTPLVNALAALLKVTAMTSAAAPICAAFAARSSPG